MSTCLAIPKSANFSWEPATRMLQQNEHTDYYKFILFWLDVPVDYSIHMEKLYTATNLLDPAIYLRCIVGFSYVINN